MPFSPDKRKAYMATYMPKWRAMHRERTRAHWRKWWRKQCWETRLGTELARAFFLLATKVWR